MKKGLCKCGSGKEYRTCCLPLHRGEPPPSALALMRSRYTAYALGDVDYILKTTHPENPQAQTPPAQIQEFCQATVFHRLTILEVQEGDPISTVTFHASLSQQGRDCSFTEKSLFKKENGFWIYLKNSHIA